MPSYHLRPKFRAPAFPVISIYIPVEMEKMRDLVQCMRCQYTIAQSLQDSLMECPACGLTPADLGETS